MNPPAPVMTIRSSLPSPRSTSVPGTVLLSSMVIAASPFVFRTRGAGAPSGSPLERRTTSCVGKDDLPAALAGAAAAGQAIEQHGDTPLAHLVGRLGCHGEEGERHHRRRQVVEADHGDVLGHAELHLLEGVQDADGDEVVRGEERRRPRRR